MSRLKQIPAVWLVLVAIVSVQIGAAYAKDLFTVTSPYAVSWLRLTVAAIFFLIFARPKITGKSGRSWLIVLGYSVCLTAMNVTIYLSFARIPIGLAVTIEFLGPLALAVIGSKRWLDGLWVLLAGLGVALLGVSPTDLDWIGIVLALVAGASWAGYIALAGPLGRHWKGVEGLTVASVLGAVVMAVPGVITGGWTLTQPNVLAVAVVVGLLSSVTPYALELEARRRLPANVFSILMSLEPAAAAGAAWLLLGEHLHILEWVAMVCVVVASVGATRSQSK